LNAGAVEHLAFNGRAFDHFLRNLLNSQAIALRAIDVMERTDNDTRTH
jgi:hypothetical protein